MSTLIFVIALIFWQSLIVESKENDGVLDKIKSGLQYAKNYLDTAKEIADLVSKSLGHRKPNEKRDDFEDKPGKNPKGSFETPKLVSGFFRLLGLDSPRVAAIAVNSVIFLAQMISSLFDVKPKIEQARSRGDNEHFNPMKFILESKNERIQNLISQAKDPALPDQLIDRLNGFDSACVRLLMCKTSPIILAAQNSLKNQTLNKRLDITAWLPTKEIFEENADSCEEKYLDCKVFPELT